MTGLSKLASRVGNLLYTDRAAHQNERVSYAKVLVEVEITKPLPEKILATLPDGCDVELNLSFEWVLKLCVGCCQLGHHQEHCGMEQSFQDEQQGVRRTILGNNLKQTGLETGWVPVAQNLQITNAQTPALMQAQNEGLGDNREMLQMQEVNKQPNSTLPAAEGSFGKQLLISDNQKQKQMVISHRMHQSQGSMQQEMGHSDEEEDSYTKEDEVATNYREESSNEDQEIAAETQTGMLQFQADLQFPISELQITEMVSELGKQNGATLESSMQTSNQEKSQPQLPKAAQPISCEQIRETVVNRKAALSQSGQSQNSEAIDIQLEAVVTNGKQDGEGPWMVQTRSRAAKRRQSAREDKSDQLQAEGQNTQISEMSRVVIAALPASGWYQAVHRSKNQVKSKEKESAMVLKTAEQSKGKAETKSGTPDPNTGRTAAQLWGDRNIAKKRNSIGGLSHPNPHED